MATMTSHGLHLQEDPVQQQGHRWPSLMGIELELENVECNYDDLLNRRSSKWTTHDDASLRAGIEFVTGFPMAGTDIDTALDQYYECLDDYSAGPRTSTHIHINVSDVTDDVVKSMFFLMYILEEGVYVLTEESRKWAGYSMPLREMAANRVRSILRPFSSSDWRNNCFGGRNSERYYGFNANWGRHGTVEFRYFPGGPSREELEFWLDLPTIVKAVAKTYTVEQLASMFQNQYQLVAFIRNAFGAWGTKIADSVPQETLWQYYEEISGMYGDITSPIRTSVAYIGPRMRKFLEQKVLQGNEAKVTMLSRLITQDAVSLDGLGNALAMAFNHRDRESDAQTAGVRVTDYPYLFVHHYDDDEPEEEYGAEEADELPRRTPAPISPWRRVIAEQAASTSPEVRATLNSFMSFYQDTQDSDMFPNDPLFTSNSPRNPR